MDWPSDPGVPARPPTQHELPYDDGEPMESDRHYEQMHLLTDSLKLWLGARDDWYVAGNRAVYFSLEQAKNQDFRAPDVIVVAGLEGGGRTERLSWVAWEEGGRLPDVVIELLSASTEREDRGRKKAIYERVWRAEYFTFDPFTHALEGWELGPGGTEYVPKRRDARGDLAVERLGMTLGVRPLDCYGLPPPSLRWILPDGTPLPTPREHMEQERARAEQERARAEQERARAEQERARADRAEAELAALREELARRG